MTASAGSGKTHQLTERYLQLLMAPDSDLQSYRHILAVTFTNKAAGEMKARIIKKLYDASQPGNEKAPQAKKRLRHLLHDYSAFSVSTIDKFFQTVMRSFAREIGQYASYRLELDPEDILGEVVDRVIASTEDPEKKELFNWLKEYSLDNVEQGKSWRIDQALLNMAKQFLSEAFLLQNRSFNAETDGQTIFDEKEHKGQLREFLRQMDQIIRSFEQKARHITDQMQGLLKRNGLEFSTFKSGNSIILKDFRDWSEGTYTEPRADFLREKIDSFPEREALSVLVEEGIALFQTECVNYFTALKIRENLYLTGIYRELKNTLDEVLRSNNIVINALTNNILSGIIGEDDTPFVYEKVGNRYDHLMLDEAQDTSRMQWDNFRPLFRNSQASGGCGLVVGDVKQSIYRWRGSDWHLMGSKIKAELNRGVVKEVPLDNNWRSGKAVVYFNNDFFRDIGNLVDNDEVRRVYASCKQIIPPEREGEPQGYVRVQFLLDESHMRKKDKHDWQQEALDRMVRDVRELRQEGYSFRDITVLVRRNREGARAADALINANPPIPVLTEDSLRIGSAPCVSRLMSVLAWMVHPEDPVCDLQAGPYKELVSTIKAGSLYETCEQLLGHAGLRPGPEEMPFVLAFLDAVLEYQDKYGSSLRDFVLWWDESGSKKKISAPVGQDAVRVMTIHKAKGLEKQAVIIPFCTENFITNARRASLLWCKTAGKPAPFDAIGMVPIKASGLENTIFAEEYEQEKTLQHIDVINNWYVAFTRAQSRLLIYAPATKDDNKNPTSIENTLFLHLKNHGLLDTQRQYVRGKRIPFTGKSDEQVIEEDPMPSFQSATTDERLRLSLQGEDYFSAEASARRMGIEEHEKMARVIVDEELERRSGGRHWFDGTYRVLNEASIVTGDGEIYRPDRVLLAPDGSRVIVIDYKFGAPHAAYHRQVRDYVSLMQQMGYPFVEGWLWYVSAGEIVRA